MSIGKLSKEQLVIKAFEMLEASIQEYEDKIESLEDEIASLKERLDAL